MKYIIEHLDKRLYKWSQIEYEHISQIVGKNNLIFTNAKTDFVFTSLSKLGKTFRESIRELVISDFKQMKLCLLDSNAKKTFSFEDKFDALVFGGILGDDPPQGRTLSELGRLKLPLRNLGDMQMPTDNAMFAAREIALGKKFSDLKFAEAIEIELSEIDSVILPFRYVLIDGMPLISDKLIKYLKKRQHF